MTHVKTRRLVVAAIVTLFLGLVCWAVGFNNDALNVTGVLLGVTGAAASCILSIGSDQEEALQYRGGIRKGATIGLVSGLLTGPTMFLFIAMYPFALPNEFGQLEAFLVPFSNGICSTIFGVAFGIIVGAVGGLSGIRLRGMRRCVLFGVIAMGCVGVLVTFLEFFRFGNISPTQPLLIVGLDLLSPILAGMAGGTLAGALSKAW
jgi:hypothetical protein